MQRVKLLSDSGLSDGRRLFRAPDEGSSSLEFITAGLLLLVPLVYLVLVLSAVQGAALAAEGAARQAARVFVQAPTEAEGFARAQRALAFGLDDYGLGDAAVGMTITCVPQTTPCLHRLASVTVAITLQVDLPLVPAVLGLDRLARVPVNATATQHVSRFWSGD
ncbi:hypothetical protein [Alpinimonas psychrophila]|uniref:hypothetical protein n=1 Tax=Alpinimonas psychrophila TaxID=748908 RepID=UPI0015FE55A1|nr:hypothetical protein [Alpinimonas psychrophila]